MGHGKSYGSHIVRVEVGLIWEYERAEWSSEISHCWGDLLTMSVFTRAQGSGKFNIVTYLQVSESYEVDNSHECAWYEIYAPRYH